MLLSEHGVAVGVWKARAGLFPLMDGPVLSQVMELCFQAGGTSRPHCSCRKDSRGRVFKTVRMLQVPSLHCCRHRSCEEGSGFKLQGGCESGHWTTCLGFDFAPLWQESGARVSVALL